MVQRFSPLAIIMAPNKIGDWTYIEEFTHISQNTTIGKYTSIANSCTIGAQDHALDGMSTWPMEATRPEVKGRNGPTVIGNDVWIGCNAVVLSGLRIGHGAVIGAGSVVTKDIPAYAIAYGNPATVRRFRFDDETIAWLLGSKWWDLPHEEVLARSRAWPLRRVSSHQARPTG